MMVTIHKPYLEFRIVKIHIDWIDEMSDLIAV